ncbi:hypothetical protein LTS18_000271 [Coniosporium uncinatum]|uniref:Uncharacterized protein n=1 Tax=Coniosporium uncinatum TaxID=93489 RepID=A0ACC3CV22_9PEZI|nr:hypothetical protein LTS18_000271 [Coniosporium uncinatum]
MQSKTGIAALPGTPGIANPLLPVIQAYMKNGTLPKSMPSFSGVNMVGLILPGAEGGMSGMPGMGAEPEACEEDEEPMAPMAGVGSAPAVLSPATSPASVPASAPALPAAAPPAAASPAKPSSPATGSGVGGRAGRPKMTSEQMQGMLQSMGNLLKGIQGLPQGKQGGGSATASSGM